jgi:hypothetical protein
MGKVFVTGGLTIAAAAFAFMSISVHAPHWKGAAFGLVAIGLAGLTYKFWTEIHA